jgi:hypothetical protein
MNVRIPFVSVSYARNGSSTKAEPVMLEWGENQ